MSAHENLSSVDAAWLSMDDPTNLMMISGVMTFRQPLNIEHFMAVAKYRWLRFDRFRQRISHSKMPFGAPYWEIDPHFNLEYHVRHIALPSPGDQTALQEMVSDLMSTPLDPTKPLWQVHIIENYGEGGALVARMHHSIADGMALVFVLLSLTDMTPDAPWPKADDEQKKKPRRRLFPGPVGAAFRGSASLARTTLGLTKKAGAGLVAARDTNRVLGLLQGGVDAGYAAARLLLLTPDPQTPFKGSLGVMKRAAWSRPLSLRSVKEIKNRSGATVNDVLVSCVTGAVRRYLLDEGAPVEDFRAVVPVNMRKPDEMDKMGNKFGLVFLSLPVDMADPLERLNEVHKRMDNLKESSEAAVALGILTAMGISPAEVQGLILRTFAAKATTVLTNVPGPPVPLFMAGSEIEDIMFWVPQSGRLGMGISILSYAGRVYVGVATDEGLVSDPDKIIKAFNEEFEWLEKTVREAAQESQHATPSAPPAEALAESPAGTRSDDLTRVQGIGKGTAKLLRSHGIITFEQLGSTDTEQLSRLLESAGGRYKAMDPANWPAQARYLTVRTGSW